jgi:hypothetical protein
MIGWEGLGEVEWSWISLHELDWGAMTLVSLWEIGREEIIKDWERINRCCEIHAIILLGWNFGDVGSCLIECAKYALGRVL